MFTSRVTLELSTAALSINPLYSNNNLVLKPAFFKVTPARNSVMK